MKGFHYGAALALVATLTAPASARGFDACVDPATDFRLDDADGSGTSPPC